MAAALATITPTSGPATTTVTITSSSTTGTTTSWATGTAAVFLTTTNPSTACPTYSGNPGATYTAATNVTKSAADTVSFTVPAGLNPGAGNAPVTYKICAYSDVAGTPAKVNDDPANLFTVLPSLSTSGGPTGTTVTVKAPAADAFSTGTPAAIYTNATTCPVNYTTTITDKVAYAATGATKVDNTTATFNIPSGVTLTSGTPQAMNLCVYKNNTGSSGAAVAGPLAFTQTPGVTSNPTSGAPGAANTITFTAPSGTTSFATAPGIRFSATGCPATYGTPGTLAVTNVTKTGTTTVTGVLPAGANPTNVATPYNVCFYAGSSSGDTLIGTSLYTINIPSVQLSSTVGTAAGGNGITATSTAAYLSGVTTPYVVFTKEERCPIFYSTTGTVATTVASRKLSNNRAAITVPALPLTNAAATDYQACIYGGTSGTSTLLSAATYTSATAPTLSAVTPAAGTVLGGTEITVSGNYLTTAPGSITATLGGLPLTDITPINATSFTARTPMHAKESNVILTVNTPNGSVSLPAAYSFVPAIEATPNTAPNTAVAVNLAIRGVGLASANFTPGVANSHIYLARGEYDPTEVVGSSGTMVNPAIAECGDVLVISDNEAACVLNLAQRLNIPAANVASRQTAATDVDTVTGSKVITSAVTGFLPSDIGKPITGTGIPAGTIVRDIVGTTQAILSKAATATSGSSDIQATIGSAALRSSLTMTGTGTPSITFSGTDLTVADVGRWLTGTGFGAPRQILSVDPAGHTAALSGNAPNASPTDVSVLANVPVPAGAYTLTFVSNGSPAANTGDVNYSQSVVTPGSTFTVTNS
ncbi:IPT/TIG domain-containing protein [Actinoplanes ianthinogenes]|uniref:IPT/TIG domain-containing protein n=1 Tax=Actinoplanes ianthinogenes TaxID=122358 RepID=UPI001670F9DD|nr:IPT/TIG domain-containing protein [Actinoplanes ianthinogenes]